MAMHPHGRDRMSRRNHRRLRLSGELLEDRLPLAWLGIPPANVAPPSATAVAFNSQRDAQGTAAIVATEVDYYTFLAPATGSYRIAAQTPFNSLDTVLSVFNSAGQRLSYNDDSGGSTDSQLALNLTSGTRYFLGITNYTGSAGGAYNWLVDGPTPITPLTDDAYEQNDSLAAARNLGALTTATNITSLVMADGADWYRFQTSATGGSSHHVAINFQHAQGDLDLELYNASDVRLARSTGTTNQEQISLSGRAAGTYYLRVYGYRGATNPSYSLAIVPPAAAPPISPTPPAGGFHIDVIATGMTASQTALFQQAADRWAQVITGDLPNATYNGQAVDDLLIHASGTAIDGAGGILGQAGPDRFRSGTSLPYHGSMEFDTADLAAMQANGTLLGVILHEMGHVLGIGTIWEYRGLLSGGGGSNPRFTGAQATGAYNQIFGRNETSVPVENSGGSGTRDSHWRETLFTNELMTGYIGPGTVLPLSRVTAASLADLGYQVNLAAADVFTPSASAAAAAVTVSTGSAAFDAALRSPLLSPALSAGPVRPTSSAATEEIVARPIRGANAASASSAVAAYAEAVDLVMAAEVEFNAAEFSLPDLPLAQVGVRLAVSPCEGAWS